MCTLCSNIRVCTLCSNIRVCTLCSNIRVCTLCSNIRVCTLCSNIRVCTLCSNIRMCTLCSNIRVCALCSNIRVCANIFQSDAPIVVNAAKAANTTPKRTDAEWNSYMENCMIHGACHLLQSLQSQLRLSYSIINIIIKISVLYQHYSNQRLFFTFERLCKQ